MTKVVPDGNTPASPPQQLEGSQKLCPIDSRCEMCDGKLEVEKRMMEDGTFGNLCKNCTSILKGEFNKDERTASADLNARYVEEGLNDYIESRRATPCCCSWLWNNTQQQSRPKTTRFHEVVVTMYTQQGNGSNSDSSIHIIKKTRRISTGTRAVGNDPGTEDSVFDSERDITCWSFWPLLNLIFTS